MKKFKTAVVQMDSGSNREDNLNKMERFLAQAAANGAQLVVFPETAEYIGNDFAGNAWEVTKAKKFFGHLAAKYGVYLHCGSITADIGADKPCNLSLFFQPDGMCVGEYSKLHMFDVEVGDGPSYEESSQIQQGEQIVVAGTALGMIGFAICYDIRFAEMFRLMALAGAHILCVCANFTMATGKDHWETLLRARAIENGCYVIAANQIGNKPAFCAYGNSMVIDPWGNVVARCSNREEVLYCDIDLDYVNQVRAQIPSLHNRREDIYALRGKVNIWE